MRTKIFFLLLFFSSCSPNSRLEYQLEGEEIAKGLLKQLQKIESIHDLKKEGAKLKKQYALFAQVMIAARKYQIQHPTEEINPTIGFEISEVLKKEFIRIYQLEGCQDVMEELQRESLHKLDLYQRRLEGLKMETFR